MKTKTFKEASDKLSLEGFKQQKGNPLSGVGFRNENRYAVVLRMSDSVFETFYFDIEKIIDLEEEPPFKEREECIALNDKFLAARKICQPIDHPLSHETDIEEKIHTKEEMIRFCKFCMSHWTDVEFGKRDSKTVEQLYKLFDDEK